MVKIFFGFGIYSKGVDQIENKTNIDPDVDQLFSHLQKSWSGISEFTGVRLAQAEDNSVATIAKQGFFVLDEAGTRIQYVALSPTQAPNLVANEVSRLESIINSLDPELQDVVPGPLHQSIYDGRSLSVLTCFQPIPSGGVRRHLYKRLVKKQLLKWVFDVSKTTLKDRDSADIDKTVLAPLQWILDNDKLPDRIQSAADEALESLNTGFWVPKTVLMHGDLWLGNVLFVGNFPRLDFRLIDWGGARINGYPTYDLVRILESLRFSSKFSREIIQDYEEKLGLTSTDLVSNLLCAVGSYGIDPDQLTLQRIDELIVNCFDYLKAVNK